MTVRDFRGRRRKRAEQYVVACADFRTKAMSWEHAEAELVHITRFGACLLHHEIISVAGSAQTVRRSLPQSGANVR